MRARMIWPACFASGAATGMCLLFPKVGSAVFFLPIPALMVLLRQTESRRTFKLCAVFCLGMCMAAYAPAFSIRPAVDESLVFWIDLGVYLAICVIHGLLFTTGLWCGLRLPCPNALRWLAVAAFWTLAERLCGAGPLAWPTLQLSLALWQYPALMQGARWGGHLLISALIMGVNVLLCQGFAKPPCRRRLPALLGAVLLFSGNVSLYIFAPSLPQPDTKIAVVQPGMKGIGEERADLYDKALTLAEEAAARQPSLILLPKGVLPSFFGSSEMMQAQWGSIAKTTGADLLAGGIDEGRSTVFHFGADSGLLQLYHKRRQVPFFENGDRGTSFSWQVDNRAGILTSQKGKAGVVICYKSMFAPMTHYAAKEDAKLLLVLTNDSWFDSDAAKRIHLAHGVYRAVETGRSLVQAGLNGYTAVIDIQGHLTCILPANQPGVLESEVSFAPQDTLYLRWGDGWLFLILVLLLANGVRFKYMTKQ